MAVHLPLFSGLLLISLIVLNVLTLRVHYLQTLCLFLLVFRKEAFLVLFSFYYSLNSRLSLLSRIKPFLNHHCALRFFNFCIHNLFIHCSSARGNCSNYLLSRLLLQKPAARLLLDADFSQPSVSLFSKLKWLLFFDLIKLIKLVLLFTILNNPDAPLSLKRKFNFVVFRSCKWSAHQSLLCV